MNAIGTFLLAFAIASAMGGVFYAGVRAERSGAVVTEAPVERAGDERTEPDVEASAEASAEADVETDEQPELEPALTIPIDLNDEDPALFATPDDIVLADGFRIGLYPSVEGELPGGVQLGALTFEPFEEAQQVLDEETSAPRRRVRRAPPRPPGPRLHPDPGIHTILTARRMMANGERMQASCYRYLSTVYERAGHSGWRNRRIVYREGRTGPYADLALIRPGDWLYIVNDPHRTPVGTHSVMFVRWEDRARGYARVISHPGWFAGPHTGREGTYDVSRTYRIIRPTM